MAEAVTIVFREDVLKLFTLYLEKVDKLSTGERAAYEKYLNDIACPIRVIKIPENEGG